MAPFVSIETCRAMALLISRRNGVRHRGVHRHADHRDADRPDAARPGHGCRRDDFHPVPHRDGHPQDAGLPGDRRDADRAASRHTD